MTQTHTGWLVFVAAIGMMAGLMATEVAELQAWSDATAPSFIGGLLAHFGTVAAAFVGGKLMPQVGAK